MNEHLPIHRSVIALLFLLILLVTYLYVFVTTDRAQDLSRFDDFKAQDTAQIARNTLRGKFLQTKYITPVGYSFLKRLESHPDYIRYPLSILVYTLLFMVFPTSPGTIKILNGLLFLLNSFILARLLYVILKTRYRDPDHSNRTETIAWMAAVLPSVLIFPYFRFALSDVNEVLVITIVLATMYALVTNRHPLLLGALSSLLYLSRPNLGLLIPFVAGYMLFRTEGKARRVRAIVVFAVVLVILLLPFVIRNVYYTGKPVFSLQQYVELNKDITGSHSTLYRSFSTPGPITEQFHDKLPLIKKKIINRWRIFLVSSIRFYILPAWLGLPFFFWLFKKLRPLLITFLFFVLAHTIIISFLLQSFRINVPIYFPLTAFGYVGLIAALEKLIPLPKRALTSIGSIILRIVFIAIICCVVVTAAIAPLTVVVHPRAQPPSEHAVETLKNHDIKYVYSNMPFWITWHADIIAIYAPVDMSEIGPRGPSECRHFIEDERYPLNLNQRKFLENYGNVIEKGDSYTLYELRIF